MLSSRPHSGANASESSSWKLDASQTIVVSAPTSPTSEASGVPTFPATRTGSPAVRQRWPSSSATVVLPLVPGDGDEPVGEQAPGELELSEHRDPSLAGRGDRRRLRRERRGS